MIFLYSRYLNFDSTKPKELFEDLINLYDDFTKNERTQSLARFAQENNFIFTKRESFGDQDTRLRDFSIFSGKGVKRLLGISSIPVRKGMEGRFRFYDYVTTKDLETKTTSILEYQNFSLDYGQFLIKPKNLLRKGISFSSNRSVLSQFQKSYKVTPPIEFSEEAINVVIEGKKQSIEANDGIMLFYRKNKQLKLSEIFEFLGRSEDFIEALEAGGIDEFV